MRIRSYENPQITPISSKIIPPSVTTEFQYGMGTGVTLFLEDNFQRGPWVDKIPPSLTPTGSTHFFLKSLSI